MELNLQRQPITINEVVHDGYAEHPIECDALLPDYCPDIVKILKCSVTTSISLAQATGERVMIEGAATAHVYYASLNGRICRAEYKIPFSRQVDLRAAVSDPVISVLPSVDYVNCRAVNQRRIDIRGALTFRVKVVDQRQEEVVGDATGGGIQLRRDMMHVTELAGQSESSFPISEELEIGYGKPPVGSIVRVEHRVNIHDYKIIAGKVVCKGDFMLHIAYQPVDLERNLEIMEYTLPLSQIIDSEGTDEECVCDVEMFVSSCDITPKLNDDGEFMILSVEASVRAVVGSHRHMEIPVASDCYSTMFDCQCKHKKLGFVRLNELLRESVMHKATLDLPEGVKSVLDAWCEVDNLSWKAEGSELTINMRLTIGMFTSMEDGESLYFEQSDELSKSVSLGFSADGVSFDPSADVLSCAYNIVGNEKIDLRCEVVVRGGIYRHLSTNSIVEIAVDENKPKLKVQNKLFIYYADAGESIWSIAKRYNTSATAVWEENSASDDILPAKTMLLIPIV